MSRFTFPPRSKKWAAAATLIASTAALAACGGAETDGVYVGTSENGNVDYRLSIDGDSCEFTSTADSVGEVPLECEIDTEAQSVSLDGYPAPTGSKTTASSSLSRARTSCSKKRVKPARLSLAPFPSPSVCKNLHREKSARMKALVENFYCLVVTGAM